MRQTPFRLLRAAVFAAVTVSASLLLHLWGGGAAPGPASFAGAFALVFALAYGVGGRQRGFAALAPLCLAAQLGLHEFFQLGAVPETDAHVHGYGAGLSMWLVHIAAALAQASWLARGESALASLLELLTLFFARVLRVSRAAALVLVRPRRFTATVRTPRPLEAAFAAISRRGPPRLAF